jgi:hypothetical protein
VRRVARYGRVVARERRGEELAALVDALEVIELELLGGKGPAG